MKLRLLFTKKCNRSCPGCCNKDWELDLLPKCKDLVGFDEIIITGGEPLLFVNELSELILNIRKQTTAKIFIYTAMVENIKGFNTILKLVDGITLTLHTKEDLPHFRLLENNLIDTTNKSMRLNSFKEVGLKRCRSYWNLKNNMEWIENCPLPKDEVFMRL
jgi:organic radical activating enzyme